MAEWTTEDREWLDLLRLIGLGGGLHESLRTAVIEEGYEAIRAHLAAHNAEVRAKALTDAADDWHHPGPVKYTAIDVSVELRARADAERGGQ